MTNDIPDRPAHFNPQMKSEHEIRDQIEKCEAALEEVEYSDQVVNETEAYISALYWVLGETRRSHEDE